MSSAKPKQVAPVAQGDLLELGTVPLPPTTARIIKAAGEISEQPPERPDFLHSVLCQVGLPRRRPEGDTFERTSGNASLLIEAGKLWNGREWKPQSLPYGTRPRLALVHVTGPGVDGCIGSERPAVRSCPGRTCGRNSARSTPAKRTSSGRWRRPYGR